MTDHIDSRDCECGPKVITLPGHEVIAHKAIGTGDGTLKRRKISGLPPGWVVVGRNPSAEVMTAAQQKSEAASFEAAEQRKQRIARKEAADRRKRGLT